MVRDQVLGDLQLLAAMVDTATIDLGLVRMASFAPREDREDFLSLLLEHLPLYYEDVDASFGQSIVTTHLLGYDPVGHFTKTKTIYKVTYDDLRIGYTVVTEKRGGSIKIGPTVLYEGWRGLGIGTHLRSIISREYAARHFRKAYSTVADNKIDSFRYLVKSSYSVEAHLRYHYSAGHGELVFGQLLGPSSFGRLAEPRMETVGRVHIDHQTDGRRAQVQDFLLRGMADAFSGVDSSFVQDLFRAEQRGQERFADKGKTVFVARAMERICGIAITTSKRGGATKVSPLLASAPAVAAALMEDVYHHYQQHGGRKVFVIVPYHHLWLIRALTQGGYTCEGLLREPYKRGVDMRVMSQLISSGYGSSERRDVVLSILPDPVRRIFARTKCFELRKQIPDQRLSGMYLYTTGFVQAFTGYVRVTGYFRLEKEALWAIVGTNACTRERFDEYYRRHVAGYAICISEVCSFRRPIPYSVIKQGVPDFIVPRQFTYLERPSLLSKILDEARQAGEWFQTPVRQLIVGHEDKLHNYE